MNIVSVLLVAALLNFCFLPVSVETHDEPPRILSAYPLPDSHQTQTRQTLSRANLDERLRTVSGAAFLIATPTLAAIRAWRVARFAGICAGGTKAVPPAFPAMTKAIPISFPAMKTSYGNMSPISRPGFPMI